MTDPHLDDDDLSAHLDGEPSAHTARHLDGCPSCHARLAALRQVATTLALAPPPPGAGAAERAVAAARQAWEQERRSSDRDDLQVPSPVTPLPPPASPRRFLAIAAAAAVVAMLVVAVPLLNDRAGDGGATQTAAPAPSAADTAEATRREMAAGQAFAALPDLGDRDDADEVAAAVRDLVVGRTGAGPAPAAAAAPAVDTQRAPLVETDDRSAPASTSDGAGPACDNAARASSEQPVGLLVYTGTLRYRGTPALVLAYQQASPPGYRVVILASEDCRPLGDATL